MGDLRGGVREVGERLCLVLGDELASYSFPGGHPLRGDRYLEFARLLAEEGLPEGIETCQPRRASAGELELFHSPEYVGLVERASEAGSGYLDYGDTPAFPGVYGAAAAVVGATLVALEAVLSDRADHGFNPIGGFHHARRDRAAGFCVFNDAGVAIEAALRSPDVERVLYVDIDAHHGDGVFYEFYDDPRVLVADVHEDGRTLYPGTGFEWETGGQGAEGTKLNVPLPPGAGDEELAEAMERVAGFAESADPPPDLVVLQAGADGLASDPLTHLRYSLGGHRAAVAAVHDLAHRLAGGRLLALGGGGYDRAALARAWLGVVEELSSPP